MAGLQRGGGIWERERGPDTTCSAVSWFPLLFAYLVALGRPINEGWDCFHSLSEPGAAYARPYRSRHFSWRQGFWEA